MRVIDRGGVADGAHGADLFELEARGGAELALLSLLASLAENGMLLVPTNNRQPGYAAAGCHRGPIAWTNPRHGVAGPTEAHLTMARAHGRHVAECATRWGLRGRAPP